TEAGGFEAIAIEWAVAPRERAENAVKKEKADAEIRVHAPVRVDGVMMNVVQAARSKEPMFEERMASHPEIRQVHTVVKIVEGEDGPGDERGQRDDLMNRCNVRDEHAKPNQAENDRRRDQPFET